MPTYSMDEDSPVTPPNRISAEKTPAFAAYVLRVGPYAGQRLSVVAAVDPTWLLMTLAVSDMEAVDATAVRGFLNTHPPLVAGDGVILGAHPLVTIAPYEPPDETDRETSMPQWNVRMAGEPTISFTRLDAARAYGEETWGIRQWIRVAKSVLVGEVRQSTRTGPR